MTNSVSSWVRATPFVVALFALAASGCVIERDGHRGWAYEELATLTVEWTLDDSFDPDACLDYGARYLELVVYDWDDEIVEDVRIRCDDFSVSLDLLYGEYAIDATLLDRSGRSVTTTLALEVELREGRETFVPIDFPVDSVR